MTKSKANIYNANMYINSKLRVNSKYRERDSVSLVQKLEDNSRINKDKNNVQTVTGPFSLVNWLDCRRPSCRQHAQSPSSSHHRSTDATNDVAESFFRS